MLSSAAQRLFELNKRVTSKLEARLPLARRDPFVLYDELVAEYWTLAPRKEIVDVGGGRRCTFASRLRPAGAQVIAVDVSADELALNEDVDERRQADVCAVLPFAPEAVGMVVSRTLIEHLADVDAFVGHCREVLCRGGYTIHLIPCRNAPFAVAARVLPFALAKRVAHFVLPQLVGVVEFPVFYDHCTPSELSALFARHGLKVVAAEISYYQSHYYTWALPIYLASVAYATAVAHFSLEDLAAYAIIVAQKQ